MHATRAAVEEGIVPGGGIALLRAKAAIGKLTNENDDVQSGINIVLKALEAPIRQIAENAGVEGSIVVGKVLANKSASYGFDAQKEEYVDVLSAGIVDPHSPLPRGGQKKEHHYPLRCQRRAGSRAGRDRLSVRSFLTRAALIGKKTARECR
jgi:hypothetical protein